MHRPTDGVELVDGVAADGEELHGSTGQGVSHGGLHIAVGVRRDDPDRDPVARDVEVESAQHTGPQQKVTEVDRKLPPEAKAKAGKDTTYGNPMLYFETVAPESGEVSLAMAWEVERSAVHGEEVRGAAPLSPSTTYYSNASGGSVTYATAGGASARTTFVGRAVAIVGPVGPTRGSARIYVDGVYRGAVSFRAIRNQSRKVVYTTALSTLGTHSIQLRLVGNGRVDLDTFVIFR